VHAVLEVRAHHRGGALGAQCDAVAALVLEGVHLLLDDVGAFAHAALENTRVLEHRRVDAAEAVLPGDVGGGIAHQAPVGLLGGQDVLRAARSLHLQSASKCSQAGIGRRLDWVRHEPGEAVRV
jgi:hypothetical protein